MFIICCCYKKFRKNTAIDVAVAHIGDRSIRVSFLFLHICAHSTSTLSPHAPSPISVMMLCYRNLMGPYFKEKDLIICLLTE